MSITGKIKTLFSDKEKTQALFPRTKVSAVSDDNGVGLNVLLEQTVPMTRGGTGAENGAEGLANMFAAGSTVLSPYQYGNELPANAAVGQVYFEEATGTIADIGQDVAKALRAVNLLDNSDFRNPVNQRGKTSYSTNDYTIDRWAVWNGSVNVADGYISVNGAMYQLIDGLDLEKTYTFAAENNAGIIVVSGKFTDAVVVSLGNLTLGMSTVEGYAEVILSNSDGHDFGGAYWAALYEGEYTAETLPPYVPKGYGVELMECQRYYLQLKTECIVNGYVASSGTQLWLQLPLTIPMRVVPTFKEVGGLAIRGTSGPTLADTFTCQSVYQVGNSLVVVLNYTGNAYAAGTPVSVYFTGNPSLSANLLKEE